MKIGNIVEFAIQENNSGHIFSLPVVKRQSGFQLSGPIFEIKSTEPMLVLESKFFWFESTQKAYYAIRLLTSRGIGWSWNINLKKAF